MKRISIVVGLVIICSLIANAIYYRFINTQEIESEQILNKPITGLTDSPIEASSAFMYALNSAKVPGWTIFSSKDARKELLLRPTGFTLREGLDSIVAAEPIYAWEIEDGVINLVPTSGAADLLNTKIRKLDITATSPDDAIFKLKEQEEIKERARELGLDKGLHVIVGAVSKKYANQKSFSARDITLRQALNLIVRTQGRGVWSYRETSFNGENGFDIDLH